MNNSPRVFVPVKTDKYDTSQAERFGGIFFLSEESISPFNINEVIWKFINSFRQSNFNPKIDYICMTGNSLILCWLSVAAMSLYKKVNILTYDSRNEEYQEKQLEKIGRAHV